MGDNQSDKGSKEENFSQSILKVIHDLSRGIDELRKKTTITTRERALGETSIWVRVQVPCTTKKKTHTMHLISITNHPV